MTNLCKTAIILSIIPFIWTMVEITPRWKIISEEHSTELTAKCLYQDNCYVSTKYEYFEKLEDCDFGCYVKNDKGNPMYYREYSSCICEIPKLIQTRGWFGKEN